MGNVFPKKQILAYNFFLLPWVEHILYFTGTAMQGLWQMVKWFYLSLNEKISDSHIRIGNVLYFYTKYSICLYEDIS